jgi:hypothetical protein
MGEATGRGYWFRQTTWIRFEVYYLWGRLDDYLYCFPNNMETEVCLYMAYNVGFPKPEAMLSTMSSEDISDCLAYTNLKVFSINFCF